MAALSLIDSWPERKPPCAASLGQPRILHVVGTHCDEVAASIESYVGHAPDKFSHSVLSQPARGAILEATRDGQFDTIHMHAVSAGLLSSRFLAETKEPLVYSPHSSSVISDDRRSPERRALCRLERAALRHSTVAVAAVGWDDLKQARALAPHVHVVHVPHATPPSASAMLAEMGSRTRNALPIAEPPVVGTVGRLCSKEDVEFFLDVVRATTHFARRRIRWIWVGDTATHRPEHAALREQLSEACVEVTGWLGRTDLLATSATFSLYIHIAERDRFPITLLGMAELGVPVIARDIVSLSSLHPALRYESSLQLAAAVAKFVADRSFVRVLSKHTEALRSEMNSDSQHEALDRVYHLALEAIAA